MEQRHKHCEECLETFEDHASLCPDCCLPLREGEIPKSIGVSEESQQYAPLVAFRNTDEAQVALAKLDGVGIAAKIVQPESQLGRSVEGASAGVPVAVSKAHRDVALQVLEEKDSEDVEVPDRYPEYLDLPESVRAEYFRQIASPASPLRVGPAPRYCDPRIHARALRTCAIFTVFISSYAIAQDVSSAFELSDQQMTWAYDLLFPVATVLWFTVCSWLGVIYRNVHPAAAIVVESEDPLTSCFRTLRAFKEVLGILKRRSNMPVVADWLYLTPQGLLVFIVFKRLASIIGRRGSEDWALGVSVLAHAILWMTSGCLLWMSFRIGAADRRIARARSGSKPR